MTHRTRGARLGLAVLGAGVLLAGGPAIAQPNESWPQETPGDALSRNLRSLVANPRSVVALVGAGRAALGVGDAQAALSFFARAEVEAPRDGRIKMWIASSLVQLEQPHAALKFFKDAAELGVPEGELARDRGLAYDIAGDQRRAQRDYRLALQSGRDAEVTRRLALSLAISGEREPALRLLDEQIQARDHAAQRTRALVLALTGDAAGASRAVETSMPGPQGAALVPFLARLPSLRPADRALAVHLGRFPQDARSPAGTAYAMNGAAPNVPARASALDRGRPDPLQPSLGRSSAAPTTPVGGAQPLRRPPGAGSDGQWSWSRGTAAQVQTVPRQPQNGLVPGSRPVAPQPSSPPAVMALDRPLDIGRAAAPTPTPRPSRLADLAATVATIQAAPVTHAGANPAAELAAKPATEPAAKPAAAKKPEAKIPSRQWVQIGIGEDQDALPGEFQRIKARADKMLAGLSGWTAPLGQTNRLLVGPFGSKDDAQEFVNALAEKRLRAFTWTSAAGEKVAKLPAK